MAEVSLIHQNRNMSASHVMQLYSTVRYGYRDNEQDSFQQGKQRRDWLDHRVAQYDSKSQNPGESRDHVDVAVEKTDKMIRVTYLNAFIGLHSLCYLFTHTMNKYTSTRNKEQLPHWLLKLQI